MKKRYTVFGQYGSAQVFAIHVAADSAKDAMRTVAKTAPADTDIFGVARGSINLITPNEDGTSAFAEDLTKEEEGKISVEEINA